MNSVSREEEQIFNRYGIMENIKIYLEFDYIKVKNNQVGEIYINKVKRQTEEVSRGWAGKGGWGQSI